MALILDVELIAQVFVQVLAMADVTAAVQKIVQLDAEEAALGAAEEIEALKVIQVEQPVAPVGDAEITHVE